MWFIWDGASQGPFSVKQLSRDPRVTPDTLAWRVGMERWRPMRQIPELEILFKDPETVETSSPEVIGGEGEGESVLTFTCQEPPWLFWILLALLVVGYALFQIFRG